MAAMAPQAGQAPPMATGKEETLWRGTPSWLLLLGKIIRAVIVAIVLPLVYYFGRDFLAQYAKIAWIIIGIIIFWQIIEVLIAWTRIRTTIYTITNQRVMIEKGVASKTVEDIDLRYIDDTQFTQSLIQRMLGIGNVMIVSSDKMVPAYVLRGIADPRNVRELIRTHAYQVSQRQLFTRAT